MAYDGRLMRRAAARFEEAKQRRSAVLRERELGIRPATEGESK